MNLPINMCTWLTNQALDGTILFVLSGDFSKGNSILYCISCEHVN